MFVLCTAERLSGEMKWGIGKTECMSTVGTVAVGGNEEYMRMWQGEIHNT